MKRKLIFHENIQYVRAQDTVVVKWSGMDAFLLTPFEAR